MSNEKWKMGHIFVAFSTLLEDMEKGYDVVKVVL